MTRIIPFIILCTVVFCTCGNQTVESSTTESSEVERNPLASYIKDEDSVFAIVEYNIVQYARKNNITIPTDGTKRYCTIDSLLHIIYDSHKEQVTSVDIKNDLTITINQLRFLNHYLLKELNTIVDKRTSALLCQEQSLVDSLVVAQQSFLRTHIDDAEMDGSCGFIKYYNVEISIISDLNSSLKDLLFSITLPSNSVRSLNRIMPQDVFEAQFQHILNNLIPQKPLFEDRPLYNYNEDLDRQSVKSIRDKWNMLLSKRDEIAFMLPERQRFVWNNATYRLKRTQLITLKNEFVNMGVYGNEIEECLLSDTCTYEQLMAYPNFTTKWEEHLKELEK